MTQSTVRVRVRARRSTPSELHMASSHWLMWVSFLSMGSLFKHGTAEPGLGSEMS